MTLNITYSCAFNCKVKLRLDLESTLQAGHFGVWHFSLWPREVVRKLYCVSIEGDSGFQIWIVRLCNSDWVDQSSLLMLLNFCSVICAWSQGNVIGVWISGKCVWKSKPQDSSFILGLTLDICWTTYKTLHGTKDKQTFTRYNNWDNIM